MASLGEGFATSGVAEECEQACLALNDEPVEPCREDVAFARLLEPELESSRLQRRESRELFSELTLDPPICDLDCLACERFRPECFDHRALDLRWQIRVCGTGCEYQSRDRRYGLRWRRFAGRFDANETWCRDSQRCPGRDLREDREGIAFHARVLRPSPSELLRNRNCAIRRAKISPGRFA